MSEIVFDQSVHVYGNVQLEVKPSKDAEVLISKFLNFFIAKPRRRDYRL